MFQAQVVEWPLPARCPSPWRTLPRPGRVRHPVRSPRVSRGAPAVSVRVLRPGFRGHSNSRRVLRRVQGLPRPLADLLTKAAMDLLQEHPRHNTPPPLPLPVVQPQDRQDNRKILVSTWVSLELLTKMLLQVNLITITIQQPILTQEIVNSLVVQAPSRAPTQIWFLHYYYFNYYMLV